MTSPNSYGSSAGVASLVPVRAGSGGDFTPSSRPTLARVEGLIDSISGMVNSMLAQAGFTIPVSQADVVLALALFVEEEVASLAEGINGAGRFGPTAKQPGGKGRYAVILDDVKAFIEANKEGFERMGAARPDDLTSGIGFKDSNEDGTATFPIFTRESFMGSETFVDEDPA